MLWDIAEEVGMPVGQRLLNEGWDDGSGLIVCIQYESLSLDHQLPCRKLVAAIHDYAGTGVGVECINRWILPGQLGEFQVQLVMLFQNW